MCKTLRVDGWQHRWLWHCTTYKCVEIIRSFPPNDGNVCTVVYSAESLLNTLLHQSLKLTDWIVQRRKDGTIVLFPNTLHRAKTLVNNMVKPARPSPNLHGNSCWYKLVLSERIQGQTFLFNFQINIFQKKKQAVCIQNQFKSESGRITGNVQINAQHTITNWLHQRQSQWKDHNMNHSAGDLQISRAELKKAVTCLCLLSLTQGLIGHLCLHNDSEGEIWLADSELD